MRTFKHESAKSFQEASELLKINAKEKSTVIAGGSDLLGGMKTAILPDEDSPKVVIDLKTIPDSSYINMDNDKIKIGALTKLKDIAENTELKEILPIISEAAKSVATPIIRNVATIGGNVCQDVRCWYYRYPHEVGDRFMCARKGGDTCYAIQGENRNHSVFGGMKINGSPCSKNCPAGTDIPAYMEKIRAGKWDEAADIIMEVNPMPMLTARICPHPCQDKCNQNEYGESVGIACVERTLGDYILANKDKFYKAPANETGKNIVIVGAGPSGLAASYYLRAQGHSVTVIDCHEKPGGVFMYGIPHYRLPKDIVESFIDALEGMGINFRMNTTVGKDITMDEIVDGYDLVYFGTGAWKQPVLGLHGEELAEFGLNFLVDVNTFLKKAIDEDVLVCGGGNTAMDVALTAKRLGAKNVRLICLEQRDEMPATNEEITRAEEEGVEIFNGWGLKGVITDENGKVTGLDSMCCTSVFDENNRFSPKYDVCQIKAFNAETIILATGQSVDVSFLGEKFSSQIKTERGLLNADTETYQTKNEKIFAGGDVVTGPNIAIRAIRAGGLAAKAMSAKMGYPVKFERNEGKYLTNDVDGICEKNALKLEERLMGERTLLDEDSKTPSLKDSQKEAFRCMNCGCYSVNASDITPVLVALEGEVITTKKTVPAVEFFTTKLEAADMLDYDEIITEIDLPVLEGYSTGYEKLRVRDSVDFAIVSLAYAYENVNGSIKDIRLAFGGVAPVPVRMYEVEKYLKGKNISPKIIEEASEIAVKDVNCLDKNTYKVQLIKATIKKVLERI